MSNLFNITQCNVAQMIAESNRFLFQVLLVHIATCVIEGKNEIFTETLFKSLLITAMATSAFYLTYPRRDAYETSHGFNVSESDITAVYEIESMANDTSYAVLANQNVSAGAIRSLGFAKYYGDLFFYPIPTGGDLYTFFLDMNNAPTRETAMNAAALLDETCKQSEHCQQETISSVFYVVNNYWWESNRIIESYH